MAKRTCKHCGKEFTVPDAWIRKGGGIHCSQACYTATQDKRPVATCSHCGKTFKVASGKSGKFCSRECYDAAHAATFVTKVCKTCGKEYTVRAIYANRYNNCSFECRVAAGGIQVCERCGKEFRVKPKEVGTNKRRYCSEACYRPPVIKTCPTCGKEFRTVPKQDKKFCSTSCYRKYTGETEPETNFRLCLEKLGQPFQQEISLTSYPTDFYIRSRNLAVEVDEPYWHKRKEADMRKVKRLIAKGHRVIRVPATPFYGDVTDEMLRIVKAIVDVQKNDIPDLAVACGNPVIYATPLDQDRMV